MKFKKKPIVIEAEQFNPEAKDFHDIIDLPKGVRGASYREIAGMLNTSGCSKELPYWQWSVMGVIETHSGKYALSPGDWIVTGVKGEKYPCKPDIFEATYKPVGG